MKVRFVLLSVMNHPNNLIYLLALSAIKGIGPIVARHLITHFGTAQAAFMASEDDLIQLNKVGRAILHARQSGTVLLESEKELTWAEKNEVRCITYQEQHFPSLLGECLDAPLFIFVKGNGRLQEKRNISIVGTRKASAWGKQFCNTLVEALSDYNVCIHSGLAYGIDIHAHRAALRYGLSTYCTLAHGLDRIYPSAHRSTATEMLEKGGWVSEFKSGMKPQRENFPRRNRIVAGISEATIVIESSLKGGSMITASLANSYNREVFAVPGRVGDVQSAGCHFLIKKNRAHLLDSVDDLLQFLDWDQPTKSKPVTQLELDLNPNQNRIITALEKAELQLDELSTALKMEVSKLSSELLLLELEGVVVQRSGKRYALA